LTSGYIHASAKKVPRAPRLFLGGRAGPTVLGTANVMMAAVLAEGVTHHRERGLRTGGH
jgi:UDP-N-acetylglucosamine 1-carboxyvinyltransferase